MSNNTVRAASLVIMTALASACSTPAPTQTPPATEPATPPAGDGLAASTMVKPGVSINAVMVGLVDHAAHNLWDV
jgi:hypothetical protein